MSVQMVQYASESLTLTPYDVKWIPFTTKFTLLALKPNGKGALNLYNLGRGCVEMQTQV